jgi:predicted O-methyltransferase YrrM
MMRSSLRNVAYRVTPRPVIEAYLRRKMLRHARRLVSLGERAGDPCAWVDELLGSHFFRLLQKRSEILRLLERVRELRPANVCEIGAAGGGTTFLFTRASDAAARIVSIDLALDAARREAFQMFAGEGQTLACVEGDSHSEATLEAVRGVFGGRALDLLYLDGDHSLEGVAEDFRMYAPLVRPGGMIVFHDIVADYRTRHGVETTSDTGGVPRFWRELKAATAGGRVEEIVEDEEQDGYGIGILHVDGRGIVDGRAAGLSS